MVVAEAADEKVAAEAEIRRRVGDRVVLEKIGPGEEREKERESGVGERRRRWWCWACNCTCMTEKERKGSSNE